jgi:hypothetical protein
MPVRLVQSVVVFGVIGLALLYLGLAALRLVSDPLAPRNPNARMVVMEALIGGFLIGRPYPLFDKLFRHAGEPHNPIYGALSFALEAAGSFTFVYWAIPVPAAFHYGWFRTMPWNS